MDDSAETQNLQMLQETESDRVLARLVPGLAHDLNSILGVALTAATHATGTLTSLGGSLEGATLTKSQLQSGLDTIEEALRLVEGNLVRAVQLV
ncbi:MAG: hypothetical protein IT186_03750 [Acidobacteria bacterium]|nr:hypothetical protein [Acidobacteriota bacterium]